jgi:hypothetical protein
MALSCDRELAARGSVIIPACSKETLQPRLCVPSATPRGLCCGHDWLIRHDFSFGVVSRQTALGTRLRGESPVGGLGREAGPETTGGRLVSRLRSQLTCSLDVLPRGSRTEGALCRLASHGDWHGLVVFLAWGHILFRAWGHLDDAHVGGS